MIDGFHRSEHHFLSNFQELKPEYFVRLKNPVTGASLAYPTVEHAFQAAKTLDDSERMHIQRARFAGIAKKMGSPKGYKGFTVTLRPDWEAIKLQVMEALLRAKFRDPQLAEQLRATGDEELRESNWWGDDFWGVIVAEGGRPCRPRGENHLGRLLMKIRKELSR